MPTTTSKGYKLPITGERGTWWTNLTDNWQRMNDHTHDGSNSQTIEMKNITKGTSTISSASWAATSGQAGTYEQTITMPTGYTLKTHAITFYVASGAQDGHVIYPTVDYVSSTSYKIYINDNTIDVKAVYA